MSRSTDLPWICLCWLHHYVCWPLSPPWALSASSPRLLAVSLWSESSTEPSVIKWRGGVCIRHWGVKLNIGGCGLLWLLCATLNLPVPCFSNSTSRLRQLMQHCREHPPSSSRPASLLDVLVLGSPTITCLQLDAEEIFAVIDFPATSSSFAHLLVWLTFLWGENKG